MYHNVHVMLDSTLRSAVAYQNQLLKKELKINQCYRDSGHSGLTSFTSSDVGHWTTNTSLCVKHCDGHLVDCERREVVYHSGRGEALLESGCGHPIRQD